MGRRNTPTSNSKKYKKVNSSERFSYDNLVSTGESKVIYANHPYLIDVFLVAVGESEPCSGNFYNVHRNDGKDEFPITGNLHVVSF